LRINRCDFDETNTNEYNRHNKLNVSRALTTNLNTLNTPSTKSRSKTDTAASEGGIHMKMESDLKYLHFFETGSSNLHLIDISNPRSISKEKVPLPNTYVVPSFHASLLTSQGHIFISGGIVEIGDIEMKCDKLSKFSLKGRGN
jgi:hypothetical protein